MARFRPRALLLGAFTAAIRPGDATSKYVSTSSLCRRRRFFQRQATYHPSRRRRVFSRYPVQPHRSGCSSTSFTEPELVRAQIRSARTVGITRWIRAVAQGGICGLVHHALLAVPTISHHACSPGDLLWLFLLVKGAASGNAAVLQSQSRVPLQLYPPSLQDGQRCRRACLTRCCPRIPRRRNPELAGNAAHDNKYRIMPRCLQLAIQNKEQLSEMRAFRPSSFAFSCRLHLPGHIDPSLPTDTKESKEAAAEQ